MSDTNDLGIGFGGGDSDGNHSSELIGELVALRAYRFDEEMSTEFGPTAATWCEALIIGDGTRPRNLGKLPVFWSAIRRQLRENKEEGYRWLVGNVTQLEATRPGRSAAYIVEQPDEDQRAAAIRTLSVHVQTPFDVELPPDDDDENL